MPARASHRPVDAAERIALFAVDALIAEVSLTPKPGLVDRRGGGAHTDLDWGLMCVSAHTLQPFYRAMAEAGAAERGRALRETIGEIGRCAETAMLEATGGINTHRGAIWALGLLVTSAAASTSTTAAATAAAAGELARLPDRFRPQETGNKGERACRDYGVGGARGQAEAAFPHVTGQALPQLAHSRRRGDSETAARLNALMAIMNSLDDTCVLSRGGPAALRELQDGAGHVLNANGVATLAGRRALMALDARLAALHVSPGGAADLLACALFLDRYHSSIS
ncbi:triphosphoribosyl-dephospho-CoA synthase [Paludibacterium yongneupense]|uniref:triphosphoribosyl-dephospho-CoA synthase n=1 Tax=Paludibacterium yongneupense TaxID=400061 RepID=UPI00041ACA30|nr:triphosphoribosyl-dephospho-CoA synthase [Paludibacterium yongneupense]